MEIHETAELFKTIKKHYSGFNASVEAVKETHRYLKDFPFEVACVNVDQHIMTEKFPPTIADIRGRLGEQFERQRSKERTESYLQQMELARACAAAPPEGFWEIGRARIRGEASE